MCVELTVADGIARVTFTRADTANAWNLDLQAGWTQALQACEADDGVRAVIVTGAGRHFCAGADMSMLDALLAGQAPPPELQPESFLRAFDFPKPLIAAMNGTAAGMGLVLALLCDVRVATPSTSLTSVFARLGLVAEHAASWLLPRLVGRAAALEILLSGRAVGGIEAAELGLVRTVVDPVDLLTEAESIARVIAANELAVELKAQLRRQPHWLRPEWAGQ